MIKESTFGNSKACVVLARILNREDNKNARAYLSNLFSEFNKRSKELIDSDLSDKSYRYFHRIMFEHFRERINSNRMLSDEIKYFANNVLKYRFRNLTQREEY